MILPLRCRTMREQIAPNLPRQTPRRGVSTKIHHGKSGRGLSEGAQTQGRACKIKCVIGYHHGFIF